MMNLRRILRIHPSAANHLIHRMLRRATVQHPLAGRLERGDIGGVLVAPVGDNAAAERGPCDVECSLASVTCDVAGRVSSHT